MDMSPRLNRCLLAASLLLPGASAQAADLSGTVWNYVQGKVATPTGTASYDGDITRLWLKPVGLNAERIMVVYSPQVSTDAWGVLLYAPTAKTQDYVGTTHWKLYKSVPAKVPGAVPRNFYLLQDGLFAGLIFSDSRAEGYKKGVLMLVTPAGLQRATDKYGSGQGW